MAERRAINVDLAALVREDGSFRTMLAWGDPVDVLDETTTRVRVRTTDYVSQPDGSIKPQDGYGYLKRKLSVPGAGSREVTADPASVKVLRVDFVDVQQGDGAVIETPEGKVLTVDGGDNQLFARYLAGRFRGTSAAEPLEIEAMVVSHGDADHFAGLTEIHDSEGLSDSQAYKRLFAHPRRVYHNGLVKRPSSAPELQSFGTTVTVGDQVLVTELADDLLAVPDSSMNTYFRAWKKALRAWSDRSGPIEFRHLAAGDDDAFDFLAGEAIEVEVLGPLPTTANGTTGLLFLGEPATGPVIGHPPDEPVSFGGHSASHTINGHSIVLRLRFGAWRFLLAGDLNAQAEQRLTAGHNLGELDLRSEVFKVPHHGSADYSRSFLQAVSPLVSVVSSGDESARKEYIHPRATLMSALGRWSRDGAPVTFVTELVAFFEQEGWVTVPASGSAAKRSFYAFSRAAFGLVRARTDGERLLVYTNSGQNDLKEAYAWTVSAAAEAVPAQIRKA
jgi:beta-lactamase superfamily II metal-dependent hydrolase